MGSRQGVVGFEVLPPRLQEIDFVFFVCSPQPLMGVRKVIRDGRMALWSYSCVKLSGQLKVQFAVCRVSRIAKKRFLTVS